MQWVGHKIESVRIDSIQTTESVTFVLVSYLKDEKSVFSMEVGLVHDDTFGPSYFGATSIPHKPGQTLLPIDQIGVGGDIGAGGKHYFMEGGFVNDRTITTVRIAFNNGTVKHVPVLPNHLFAYGSLDATGLMSLTGYDRRGHIVWTMK